MPNVNDMFPSKFLTKDDAGSQGITVTIATVEQKDVSLENEPTKMCYCLGLRETPKLFVLNKTNAARIAELCGSENSDDWINHQIILYDDPDVEFQGKRTGGLRVFVQRSVPAQAVANAVRNVRGQPPQAQPTGTLQRPPGPATPNPAMGPSPLPEQPEQPSQPIGDPPI